MEREIEWDKRGESKNEESMRVKGKKGGGGDIDYGYRIRIREQDPLSEQLKKTQKTIISLNPKTQTVNGTKTTPVIPYFSILMVTFNHDSFRDCLPSRHSSSL